MKKNIFIKKIEEAMTECFRAEMPKFINMLVGQLKPSVAAQESTQMVYITQLASAQEFLNHNRNADLSKLKCLLRQLMPQEYYGAIDKLHEREDTGTVYIVNGGINQIAPNAEQAKQNING